MRSLIMKPATILSAAAFSLAAMATGAAAQQTAIVNAEIHMAGSADAPRTIRNGTILINDGEITAVGANVSAPDGFDVIDAEGRPVTPGLFASISGVGLEEVSLNSEGNDKSTNSDFPLSAAIRAVDALNTESSYIGVNGASGVTRAYSTTDPSGKLFGGCGMVIELNGSDDPVIEPCLAQIVALGQSGAYRAGDSKAGAIALLRYYLTEARRYAEAPEDYRYMAQVSDLTVPDLAALEPYVSGDKPMLVSVHSAPDIRRVIALQQEFGLDLVLMGATEAWRVADELAVAGIPVIINPMDNLPSAFESLGATMENAARLQEAGVLVAFYDNDMGYTHNLRMLTQLAGNAVANGMEYDAALAAITLNPARVWGQDDEVGTVQAGKVADLVLWSGDPLELSSRPEMVMIGGEEISLQTRQDALVSRYRDLSRGDMPPAYRGD